MKAFITHQAFNESDGLAVRRPAWAVRRSCKIGELLIVKAGSSYRPELLFVLLADRRKDSQRLGIGRAGGFCLGSLTTLPEVDPERGDRASVGGADKGA